MAVLSVSDYLSELYFSKLNLTVAILDCYTSANPSLNSEGVERQLMCDYDSTVLYIANDTAASLETWGAEEYTYGSGSREGVYWLGNAYATMLTVVGLYTLRIDMWDASDVHYYVEFSPIAVGSSRAGFAMSFGEYTGGSAADGGLGEMTFPFVYESTENCTISGGWWLNVSDIPCVTSTLTGSSKVWTTFQDETLDIKQVIMRIFPDLADRPGRPRPQSPLVLIFHSTTCSQHWVDENSKAIVNQVGL